MAEDPKGPGLFPELEVAEESRPEEAEPAPPEGPLRLIAVAVPLPLPTALTYSVPDGVLTPAVGARVRVRVGSRKITGFTVEHPEAAPEGISVRPILGVVDRGPVLPESLIQIARFVSEYYLAPLGEVLQTVLPSKIPPWGDQRVRLTNQGAMALPRNDAEAAIIDFLRDNGPASIAELEVVLGDPNFRVGLEGLRRSSWVTLSGERGAGRRTVRAVELVAGDLEEQLEAVGRSAPGRRVVEYLSGLERPATVTELTAECECSDGVVRRLVGLGIVQQFDQLERRSLDDHWLAGLDKEAFELRPGQENALTELVAGLDSKSYRPFLLDGMTGSGKTEVYLRAAVHCLAQGRQVVLLVPELALVPALAGEVRRRFGREVAILHSGLSASERAQEWDRIRQGSARVVLGARSAVFAPLDRLGMIVVDEEQDGAYKQGSSPRYNGRDLALVRGAREGATVVLVSATPSLETRLNCETARIVSLPLTERVGASGLPEGILVDLRGEGLSRRPGEVHFSDRLKEEIERTLTAGDQTVLLRNRRGYAPVLLCRACGEDQRCDDCGLPRTYHKARQLLVCHYCGSRLPAPAVCNSCDAAALEPVGTGTERVEELFAELFPGVSVDVLDRDTVRRRGGIVSVLDRFARRESQVLIGTQMVSKGHHFPNVALAGVLLADSYLGFPDFRAAERTYSLLTQLAGRAGRGDRPGRFIVQTYHPEHYALQAVLAHDDQLFAEEEMRFRRVFHYPPYTRMVQLMTRDTNRSKAESRLRELTRAILEHPKSEGMRVVGPAPAPFEKLKGQWRFQLLVRSRSGKLLRQVISDVLPEKGGAELVVDVDPLELL